MAQGLFGDAPRLVVQDLTDLWYLHAVSEFLADQGGGLAVLHRFLHTLQK